MNLLDMVSEKKGRTYAAIRYSVTGVDGYIFKKGDAEVFQILHLVMPHADILMRGCGKVLNHKNYDADITLLPGVRRTVVDELGKPQGYFMYVSFKEFRIGVGSMVFSVKISANGWEVFDGAKRLANIYKIPAAEMRELKWQGYDEDTRFIINISEGTNALLYPYIMAVPVLGF